MRLDEEDTPIVVGEDWLVGGDRRAAAAERIYDAAATLIARHGINNLDIGKLAIKVHCSRATIYRYAGGKTDIRNVVLARAAARIADAVRSGIEGLTGCERLVTAIILSVQQVRSDPLGQLMIGSIRGGTREVAWLAESPLLSRFAADLTGLAADEPHAAKWIVRIALSLMYWPAEDDDTERLLVERYVAPAFAEQS